MTAASVASRIGTWWDTHADDPARVAHELTAAIGDCVDAAEAQSLARLITHLCGEHLGQWAQGMAGLAALQQTAAIHAGEKSFDAQTTVQDGRWALAWASDPSQDLQGLDATSTVRVLAMAAPMLAGQGRDLEAIDALRRASVASDALPPSPALSRPLAVAGNNLALHLEERPAPKADVADGLVMAAQTALKHWAIAGTWLEVERAEYRLTRAHLKLGQTAQAVASARRCLALCLAHQAVAFELFFAHAVLALAMAAHGDTIASVTERDLALAAHDQLSAEDQAWCKTELKEMAALSDSHPSA